MTFQPGSRRRLGDTDRSLGERIARLEATVESMSDRSVVYGLALDKFEERLLSVERTIWRGIGALGVLVVIINLLGPIVQNFFGLPH